MLSFGHVTQMFEWLREQVKSLEKLEKVPGLEKLPREDKAYRKGWESGCTDAYDFGQTMLIYFNRIGIAEVQVR